MLCVGSCKKNEGRENVITSAEVQLLDGSYAPIDPTATYTIGGNVPPQYAQTQGRITIIR